MRSVGVEEELLLVSEETGAPVAIATYVLDREAAPGVPDLTAELQQEMIEIVTRPTLSGDELHTEIVEGRARADAAAREIGARAVALATSPIAVLPHTTMHGRYQQMAARYGITARRTLVCGCHVHVSIDSPEEGVAVLDRIRVWLPVLLALSSNSPYADGEDTEYASYRSVAWRQWPSAGPLPLLGSPTGYEDHARRLRSTGVLLDEGMFYFDARLARAHPTVEIRVADICAGSETATAIAMLARALVDTAAQEWRDGRPAPDVTAAELRLDSWQAALRGLSGDLVHPLERTLRPASVVVNALLSHVSHALERSGNVERVHGELARLASGQSGAQLQRAAFHRTSSLQAVVADAIARTHATTGTFSPRPEPA
ncbi:glutamate--cysteine ligase [Gryllotalpicola reticulitermitis]|uniref:Putative glutamate--cysteine ligase 2 n=1 Tax=Gryllotalpicola reticulitermitis TaxID=1184153 RepID=A0ABV8Q5Z9_9MICO